VVSSSRSSFPLEPMGTKEAQVSLPVCIANTGYEDLEVRKAYRVLADRKAAEPGCLRVIDESGEDYLYPADRFMALELSAAERNRLRRGPLQPQRRAVHARPAPGRRVEGLVTPPPRRRLR
jgi:hypothetical protein